MPIGQAKKRKRLGKAKPSKRALKYSKYLDLYSTLKNMKQAENDLETEEDTAAGSLDLLDLSSNLESSQDTHQTRA